MQSLLHIGIRRLSNDWTWRVSSLGEGFLSQFDFLHFFHTHSSVHAFFTSFWNSLAYPVSLLCLPGWT